MKKGYLYTILFAFTIALLFSAVLGGMNSFYKDKIAVNAVLSEKRAILDSLDIKYEENNESVERIFKDNIRISEADDRIYEMYDTEGSTKAYSVKFTGKGLWGTILGYIGINDSLDAIIAFQFTEQNETPGLGGRIAEDDFRDQFRQLKITREATIEYNDEIQAITGATSSSSAVLSILNKFIQNDLKVLEELKNE